MDGARYYDEGGRRRSPIRQRLAWFGRDIGRLAWFALGALLAYAVPRRFHGRIGHAAAAAFAWKQRRKVPKLANAISGGVGARRPDLDYEAVAHDNRYTVGEDWWARGIGLRPRRWSPTIEVRGMEHLRRAQEAGRGVVVWRAALASTLVVKAALADNGVELVHLSRHDHGVTNPTWLGRHVLGPLYVKSENAYVSERIIIADDGDLSYLRALVDRLRTGAVVSIVGDHRSRTPFVWPVLGKPWAFATGAPSLSRLTGCALIPVFTARTGRQHYVVEIQTPIEPPRRGPRRAHVASAVGEFAGRLERWLVEHPADWYSWPRYAR